MGILDNILGKKNTQATTVADPLAQTTTPNNATPPAPLNAVADPLNIAANPLNTSSPSPVNNNLGQTTPVATIDPLAQADSLLGQAPGTIPSAIVTDPLKTPTVGSGTTGVAPTVAPVSPPSTAPDVAPLNLGNEVASPLLNSVPSTNMGTTTPPPTEPIKNDPLMNTTVSSASTLKQDVSLDQPAIDLLGGAGTQTTGGMPDSNRGKQLIGEIEAKLSELKRLMP